MLAWWPSNLNINVLAILVFYILPFIIAVLLPAYGIPKIVKRFSGTKGMELPSFFPFTLTLVVGALVANIFWQFVLFNHIYYEWDRVFLPYTFFGAEVPLLDASSSWILEGWTTMGLRAVWFVITVFIFCSGVVISCLFKAKENHFRQYRKILITSVVVLCLVSVAAPYALGGIFYLVTRPFARLPTVIDQKCPQISTVPRVMYESGAYYVSDIHGQNIKELVSLNHTSIDVQDYISPDGSMFVDKLDRIPDQIWIKCIDGNGFYPILMPRVAFDTGTTVSLLSRLSWSPDGKKLAANYAGNLVVINPFTKAVTTLKTGVALKKQLIKFDNPAHVTAKKDFRYEVGDVLWSPKNIIYYTTFGSAFTGGKSELHALDMGTNTDAIILDSNKQILLHSANSDGSSLVIDEIDNKDYRNSTGYILNLQTKERSDYQVHWAPNSEIMKWSDTPGVYTLDSGGSWIGGSTSSVFPVLEVNRQTNTITDLNPKILSLLNQSGISTDGMTVVIRVVGFVGKDILTTAAFHKKEENFASTIRQINSILTADGKLRILQDYSYPDLARNDRPNLTPVGVIYSQK